MAGIILDGKTLSNKIFNKINEEVQSIKEKGGRAPGLCVILVGENPASEIYVKNKEKKALEAGFKSTVHRLSKNVSKEELLELIDKLNKDNTVDGILLQLPLPNHLKAYDFLDKIDPKKDVDGFHPINQGKLLLNENPYGIPCTPKGIIRLLDEYNIKIEGKRAVIIGRSNIVGKPLGILLLNRNATVTFAHSKTENLSEITKNADILISATGQADMVKADMVKKGAAVIDVGIIRREDGKLRGDVDFNNVKEIAGAITPVPGGVGPMTIAALAENTLEMYKMGQDRRK